jgi:hypothetical protein
MNNKLTKIVKTIILNVRTNVLEIPHPTLVAFAISAAVTMAVAVGIAMLAADHSHFAYARVRIKPIEDWIH